MVSLSTWPLCYAAAAHAAALQHETRLHRPCDGLQNNYWSWPFAASLVVDSDYCGVAQPQTLTSRTQTLRATPMETQLSVQPSHGVTGALTATTQARWGFAPGPLGMPRDQRRLTLDDTHRPVTIHMGHW
jgi:hypothetical protein